MARFKQTPAYPMKDPKKRMEMSEEDTSLLDALASGPEGSEPEAEPEAEPEMESEPGSESDAMLADISDDQLMAELERRGLAVAAPEMEETEEEA